MALEVATYLTELVATNPTSSDSVKAGDDHLRLLKAVLQATFPNLDGPVDRTPAQLNYPVPIGSILMWSSTAGAIPTGWGLCDGSVYVRTDGAGNITSPDLRDRFVVGAGGSYANGTSGNNASKTTSSNGSHTHTGSADSGGAHTHSVSVASSGAHTHSGTTDLGGNHTHGGTTGAGGVHDHGANTGNHTLTLSQIPSHRHNVVANGGETGALTASNQLAVSRSDEGIDSYGLRGIGTDATLGRTSAEGSGGAHNHSITPSGAHNHSISASGTHDHDFSISSSGAHTHSATSGSGGTHTHDLTIASGGAHTHTVDVVPPYFALRYIMKY